MTTPLWRFAIDVAVIILLLDLIRRTKAAATPKPTEHQHKFGVWTLVGPEGNYVSHQMRRCSECGFAQVKTL